MPSRDVSVASLESMATPARADAGTADELVWLQRALFVLVRPREVLALLRDDSEAAARARSEAVLALVWLSGIAAVLWTPTYGHLQDDVANDALNVAVIAFIVIELAFVAWALALLVLGLRLLLRREPRFERL